jgi:hypothetical protein
MKRLLSSLVCTLTFILVTKALAVPLSLSPAAISRSYTGALTLQISGLTNGERVVIERYLDMNGNGTIEAGEPLVDSFSLADGEVSTIGGVTNLNVPYDRNPAAGAITTTLSFALPIEAVIGNQIFRLISPYGNFAPQTNILTVTNANLAQTVSGTISAGASPVPYAMAVALSMPNNNFVAGVFADASGHYSIKLDPGTYFIMPALPNYYTDQSLAALVTLTNGGSISADLFLTNGSAAYTISGQVADATNGLPLGGVFMQFESGNLFGVGFTDSNGNYSAPLNSSVWRLKLEGSRLSRRAYVVSQNKVQVDASAGSVANVNFLLPKANALFYGRFTDSSSVPFANIDLYGQDDSGHFKSDGYSDANGNYAVGVLAGPGTGQWNSEPGTGENPQLQNYLIGGGLGTTPISPGQAIHQDFTAIHATAQISGHISDNSGGAVSDVGISGNALIGGTWYSVFSTTDNSGNYVLPATTGTWSLNVNCCGNQGLDSYGLYDPQMHTVSIPPNNATLNITVYPTGTPFLSQPVRISPSQFVFGLNGSPGVNYTIQASTDLSHWSDLFSLNLTSNWMSVQDNQATNNVKFYRVKKN